MLLFGDSQVVLVVKNLPANAEDIRDVGLIPELGRSPQVGHGNPLQHPFLEGPMDRGTQRATVYRVAKTWTQRKHHGTPIYCCSVAKSCLTLPSPWTVALQVPLSMGSSRQGCWSGLPFPSPMYVCMCIPM